MTELNRDQYDPFGFCLRNRSLMCLSTERNSIEPSREHTFVKVYVYFTTLTCHMSSIEWLCRRKSSFAKYALSTQALIFIYYTYMYKRMIIPS